MEYILCETEMQIGETCERVKTYGIIVLVAEEEICCVPDVSLNQDYVKSLVVLLNQYEASEIHFREIIDDFIGNEEFFSKK